MSDRRIAWRSCAQTLGFKPLWALAGWFAFISLGCPTDGDNNVGNLLPPNETNVTLTSTTTWHTNPTHTSASGSDSSSTESSSSTNDTATSDETATTETAETTTSFVPLTCEDIICRGHGGCQLVSGAPVCVCDEAYILDEAGEECIVDESCINIRYLEPKCRQRVGGIPAVTLFFAIDFCAGTAVLPEKLEELNEEKKIDFQVLEGGVDILQNPESSHALYPTAVESYVAVVLDVSKSVTGDESDETPPSVDLDALVEEMSTMVSSLEPTGDEAPVYVSLWVFARGYAEYVPFTNDFAELDSKIAQIKEGQDFLPSGVGIYGSDLYAATSKAIDSVDRIRELRDIVTRDGVLTTGTVLVITDGNDESGALLSELDQKIQRSINQVISIGISERADEVILDTIGRDGSFLAPTPEDWEVAFAEITARVDNYPKRTYLLGYCSSKTTGLQEVEVTLATTEETPLKVTAAGCLYDADEFSSDGSVSCNGAALRDECDKLDCGGLTACGACADDECCVDGQCLGPQVLDDCEQMRERCHAAGQICEINDPTKLVLEYGCIDPPTVGEACLTACKDGDSFCWKSDDANSPTDTGVCVAVWQSGDPWVCETASQCSTLNCTQKNTDSETDPLQCLPPARVHDNCGPDGEAICEAGSYCASGRCVALKPERESCTANRECESTHCVDQLCVEFEPPDPLAACFFTWDEKVQLKD